MGPLRLTVIPEKVKKILPFSVKKDYNTIYNEEIPSAEQAGIKN